MTNTHTFQPGDRVQTPYGKGIVVRLNNNLGATVAIERPTGTFQRTFFWRELRAIR